MAVRAAGNELRWSNTAVVHEYVGPDRTNAAWLRRRSRISTKAWVQSEIGLQSPSRIVPKSAARAVVHALRGAALLGVGTLAGNRRRVVQGYIYLERARGNVDAFAALARRR